MSLNVPLANHQYCYICSIKNYLLQILMPNHATCYVKYTVCSSGDISGTVSYQYFSARLCEKSKYCVENIFIRLRNNAWAVVSAERTASFVLTNLQMHNYKLQLLFWNNEIIQEGWISQSVKTHLNVWTPINSQKSKMVTRGVKKS